MSKASLVLTLTVVLGATILLTHWAQQAEGLDPEKYVPMAGKPVVPAEVPKDWGRLVGVTPRGADSASFVAWFEASDGTVRGQPIRFLLGPAVGPSVVRK